MASGAAFHRAYPRATQQAFLEAHEHAFAYFGGVHRVLRYDNLTSAVRKVLRGHRREETVRFVAFRSHWRFEAQFCPPAAGHEKGGVEGEIGYFRRNHWVPVPSAADLDELNKVLLAGCRADERRRLDGREQCVGEALAIERDHLLPSAETSFDLAEVSFPVVSASGCITVHTNAYSVPLRPGSKVQASLYAAHLEIWHDGVRVARHERCHRRRQQVLDLDHYLDVLERKPGAMAGSKPLEQWRQSGRWPAEFDALWWRLNERHGRQDGTRAMIGGIMLGRQFGHDRVREAVALAVAHGACDPSAVRYLLTAGELRRSSPAAIEVGALRHYDRPLPRADASDQPVISVAMKSLSQAADLRLPLRLAFSVELARAKLRAILRSKARFRAAVRSRTRLASSLNPTSSTQWRPFSIAQWLRMAEASCVGGSLLLER